MKFEQQLQQIKDANPRNVYLDYTDLKKQIKYLVGETDLAGIGQLTAAVTYASYDGRGVADPIPSAQVQFQSLLLNELSVINDFARSTTQAIMEQLTSLTRRIQAFVGKKIPDTINPISSCVDDKMRSKFRKLMGEWSQLSRQANESVSHVIEIDGWRRTNFTAFRKITKKYDKTRLRQDGSVARTQKWLMELVLKAGFMRLPINHMINALSEIFFVLRKGSKSLRDHWQQISPGEKPSFDFPPEHNPMVVDHLAMIEKRIERGKSPLGRKKSPTKNSSSNAPGHESYAGSGGSGQASSSCYKKRYLFWVLRDDAVEVKCMLSRHCRLYDPENSTIGSNENQETFLAPDKVRLKATRLESVSFMDTGPGLVSSMLFNKVTEGNKGGSTVTASNLKHGANVGGVLENVKLHLSVLRRFNNEPYRFDAVSSQSIGNSIGTTSLSDAMRIGYNAFQPARPQVRCRYNRSLYVQDDIKLTELVELLKPFHRQPSQPEINTLLMHSVPEDEIADEMVRYTVAYDERVRFDEIVEKTNGDFITQEDWLFPYDILTVECTYVRKESPLSRRTGSVSGAGVINGFGARRRSLTGGSGSEAANPSGNGNDSRNQGPAQLGNIVLNLKYCRLKSADPSFSKRLHGLFHFNRIILPEQMFGNVATTPLGTPVGSITPVGTKGSMTPVGATPTSVRLDVTNISVSKLTDSKKLHGDIPGTNNAMQFRNRTFIPPWFAVIYDADEEGSDNESVEEFEKLSYAVPGTAARVMHEYHTTRRAVHEYDDFAEKKYRNSMGSQDSNPLSKRDSQNNGLGGYGGEQNPYYSGDLRKMDGNLLSDQDRDAMQEPLLGSTVSTTYYKSEDTNWLRAQMKNLAHALREQADGSSGLKDWVEKKGKQFLRATSKGTPENGSSIADRDSTTTVGKKYKKNQFAFGAKGLGAEKTEGTAFARQNRDFFARIQVRDAVVRVEPKTFFANERTMLDWLSLCVTIGTIGVGLVNSVNPGFIYLGQILLVIVLIFIIYAVRAFRTRNRLLLSKTISVDGHYDLKGPFVLILLLSSLTISCVLTNNEANERP